MSDGTSLRLAGEPRRQAFPREHSLLDGMSTKGHAADNLALDIHPGLITNVAGTMYKYRHSAGLCLWHQAASSHSSSKGLLSNECFLVAAWHKAHSTLQKLPPGLRELKDMSGAMLSLQLQHEMPRNPISYCVATQGSRPSAGKLKLR